MEIEKLIMYTCRCYGNEGPYEREDLDHMVNAFLAIVEMERAGGALEGEDD